MKHIANHWNYYSQIELVYGLPLFDNFIDRINARATKLFSLKLTLSDVFNQ